jgi:hypothetical protein
MDSNATDKAINTKAMKVITNAQNNMCVRKLILFQFHFSPPKPNAQTHASQM